MLEKCLFGWTVKWMGETLMGMRPHVIRKCNRTNQNLLYWRKDLLLNLLKNCSNKKMKKKKNIQSCNDERFNEYLYLDGCNYQKKECPIHKINVVHFTFYLEKIILDQKFYNMVTIGLRALHKVYGKTMIFFFFKGWC